MSNLLTLLRREVQAYFGSWLGYVVLIFFLVVMGITFAVVVGYLNQGPTQFTPMELLFSMFWLPALVIVPAITMRLLAEEKRSGTIEVLMTAPVRDVEVVLAKWLGAVGMYALMWGATLLYVLTLRRFAGPAAVLDMGPIWGGYVGVLLIGQFLVAIGVLASSLTRNQVAAALMSFALIFVLLVATNWMTFLFQGGPINTFFRYISPFEHMKDFARGIVDMRPVVLYLSGSVWVLFLTTRAVESRKWR